VFSSVGKRRRRIAGLPADPVARRETARGRDNTIGVLKGLSFDEEANTGRGFSRLALPGLRAGQGGFRQGRGAFRDRWPCGVRSLAHAGNQFAFRLEITAVVYADTEDYLTRIPGAAFGRFRGRSRRPATWQRRGDHLG
jgi:hypothetical protein